MPKPKRKNQNPKARIETDDDLQACGKTCFDHSFSATDPMLGIFLLGLTTGQQLFWTMQIWQQ
jgi:hypothetical protein